MPARECPKCGAKLQPEYTEIINIKKARERYQQRKLLLRALTYAAVD